MSTEEMEELITKIQKETLKEVRKIKLKKINGEPFDNVRLDELQNDHYNTVICNSTFSDDPFAKEILRKIQDKYAD